MLASLFMQGIPRLEDALAIMRDLFDKGDTERLSEYLDSLPALTVDGLMYELLRLDSERREDYVPKSRQDNFQ